MQCLCRAQRLAGLQLFDQRDWIGALQALGARVCVSESVPYRSLAERAVVANDRHVLLEKGAYRTGPRVADDVRDEYGAHERVPCGLTFALERGFRRRMTKHQL